MYCTLCMRTYITLYVLYTVYEDLHYFCMHCTLCMRTYITLYALYTVYEDLHYFCMHCTLCMRTYLTYVPYSVCEGEMSGV